MKKTKIGVVGCGNISGIYLTNLTQVFKTTEVVAVTDLIMERAEAAKEKYGIAKALPVNEFYDDKEIEVVLNITNPKSHREVSELALNHGKHVHSEKPLATTFSDGKKIVELGREKNLRVGGAPDTFMGGGLQTCRKLIDEGAIGKPVAATLFMLCHGHEGWHPDPEFYYEVGGGPMLDMGPYYLTALVSMLGNAKRVTASANITFPTRTITSEKKNGKIINVEVPTHVSGIVDMECGAVANVITSFDIWGHTLPCIEIYGSEGTLQVPDPNTFGGCIKLRKYNENEWTEIPLTHGYSENSRGIAIADMGLAINEDRPHRAHGDMALHVLEIMESFHVSSKESRHINLTTKCQRPEIIPIGYDKY